MVSVHAFYSDDPSSNPTGTWSFFCKFVFEKNDKKMPGSAHLKKLFEGPRCGARMGLCRLQIRHIPNVRSIVWIPSTYFRDKQRGHKDCNKNQKTLTVGVRITVQLVSSLTRLDLTKEENILVVYYVYYYIAICIYLVSSWIQCSLTGDQLYSDHSPYSACFLQKLFRQIFTVNLTQHFVHIKFLFCDRWCPLKTFNLISTILTILVASKVSS